MDYAHLLCVWLNDKVLKSSPSVAAEQQAADQKHSRMIHNANPRSKIGFSTELFDNWTLNEPGWKTLAKLGSQTHVTAHLMGTDSD